MKIIATKWVPGSNKEDETHKAEGKRKQEVERTGNRKDRMRGRKRRVEAKQSKGLAFRGTGFRAQGLKLGPHEYRNHKGFGVRAQRVAQKRPMARPGLPWRGQSTLGIWAAGLRAPPNVANNKWGVVQRSPSHAPQGPGLKAQGPQGLVIRV